MNTTKHVKLTALGLFLSVAALQAHSDAFKPAFVDTLVAPYLSMQKGLASDDLKVAQVGAKAFLEAMKQAPQDATAQKETAALSAPAKSIAEAEQIAAARTAFLELSKQFATLVEHVGTSGKTPLFVAHCPMAFDNQGASWIQGDKEVANPYYGAMMLRCGGIQEQLARE